MKHSLLPGDGKKQKHCISTFFFFLISNFVALAVKIYFVNKHGKTQVGKAYFELVDYMEADRAFNLARRTTPYSLEGMDIYSTVLYVSATSFSYFVPLSD